jgi:hypothetical protein
MKSIVLIATVLVCGLSAVGQGIVSPEDKALLEKLSHDKSFTVVDRVTAEYLSTINDPKRALYKSYLEKAPAIVKVFLRKSAGWEGQYTMTWFTVESGNVSGVEAYFGDPSGSGELQYVRQYKPEKITLGYFDKNWKCIPLPAKGASEIAELCIGYYVPSEPRMKVF